VIFRLGRLLSGGSKGPGITINFIASAFCEDFFDVHSTDMIDLFCWFIAAQAIFQLSSGCHH
jgi:hypothetical protein